jgi:hypothetical protein
LNEFCEANPDIYKYKNPEKGLKADFVSAESIIARILKDKMFKDYMSGEKQVIMTANMFGIDWKIKMDSYFPDDKIVDLKIMKDMKPIWSDKAFSKMDFIHYWGYDIQGAIYQKVVEKVTGKKLPFYIACATKEDATDIAIIEITQPYLDAALRFVEENIERVIDAKNGKVELRGCGVCPLCKSYKVIATPTRIDDIVIHSEYMDSLLDSLEDEAEDDTPDIASAMAGNGFTFNAKKPATKGYTLFDDTNN